MVNAALLDAHGEKILALIFDKGDEVVAELTAFAKREKLGGSHHTAIGAFSDVSPGLLRSGAQGASDRSDTPGRVTV